MKKILWISRHQMTGEQLRNLERVMNEPVILVPWRETVETTSVLIPLISEVDAVAAVLPLELLAELFQLANGKPVMIAVSARHPTGRILTLSDGRQEPEFDFVHSGWLQIIRLELETRLL